MTAFTLAAVPYGNGAFGGEEQVMVHVSAYGTCHLQHLMDIGAPVFFRRCAYGTEYNA